jgi:proline racemase
MQLDISPFDRLGDQLITVDSHTAGEPTRLVVGGLPALPGETINDKRLFVQENLDRVRLLLTQEPRGHRDIFGAIATPPVSPEGDFGLIFMDAKRYPYMCGHGTIGAVSTFIEMGWLPVEEGEREKLVVVDTPSGIVHAQARLDHRPDGRVRVESVAIQIEAAFVHKIDQPVDVPGIGVLKVDVVCVGGYFAMVSADQIDIPLKASRAKDLADLGMAIIEASNRQLTIQHPIREFVNTIDVTEFYTPATSPQTCNAVIYGESHVDRSPCGTGTSAKMALLHHHGLMAVGDTLSNHGLLGTTFEGRIVKEVTVGDFPAIVPEIRGSAHITGLHRFVVADDDPFPQGFLF